MSGQLPEFQILAVAIGLAIYASKLCLSVWGDHRMATRTTTAEVLPIYFARDERVLALGLSLL